MHGVRILDTMEANVNVVGGIGGAGQGEPSKNEVVVDAYHVCQQLRSRRTWRR